jgi:hypothetical protein
VCPIEAAFLNSVNEAKYNADLFKLVKTRERKLKLAYQDGERIRDQMQQDKLKEMCKELTWK